MKHTINIKSLIESLSDQAYQPYHLTDIASVDSFLKIRETLTRIGRLQGNKVGKESLWQVCHIVQCESTSEYYLVHFKHLYLASGKDTNTEFNEQDYTQMNYIASLLEKWGLARTDEDLGEIDPRCNISVIPFARKKDVLLRKKFYIRENEVK